MRNLQYFKILRRIGYVLIAFSLAFLLVSLLSQESINATTQYTSPSSYFIEGQNYYTICCNPSFMSPKSDLYLNISPQNSSITVYFMKTNSSEFDSSLGNGIQPGGYYGFYISGTSSSFLSFLSAHHNELLEDYNISKGSFVSTNFFPTDVEPIMIVILNSGSTNTTVSTTFYQIGIIIPPTLGLDSAAAFFAVGAILAGISFFLRKK